MTITRPHDTFGNHEGGPHLRYVQQYATDADPDQPVQVKLLGWDGSAFVMYGDEFRIGEAATASLIGAGQKFWIVWRRDAQRWMPVAGTSTENFRLIRGQSVGAQSGGTILIDNVDVLAGGLDPSGGNPATQVTVQNIFGQSYADNDPVQAIYNQGLGGTDLTDWENIKSTGTEQYRVIRGLVKGAVSADDTTFPIDNVIPLGSGNDPVSGNAATEITVQNVQKETFLDNTPITAIYDGANWEVLLVERYRVIRGKAVGSVSSGAGTFTIDAIDVIAGSVDPRSDPTSETEAVTVRKTWPDRYLDNADVFAGHNPRSGEWDVMSRGGSAGEVTIKSVDTIELNITGTAPNQKLEVKLNYKEFTVFAEEGAAGFVDDDLDADPFVCPS